ncbi:MAG: hypothetical protein FJ368_06265 [Pelagibacterales bacterium]|nr:hypothetical protein [Pelagibacterales bacterium]
MGLDMYLYKRTDVKNWNFLPNNYYEVTVKRGGDVYKDIKAERINEVVEEVLYWRKANQIHAWFVTNVQDDVDDCRESFIDYEKLKELLKICKKVQADHSLAEELLPSKSGFFFGSTEYDEYYFEDISYTIDELEKILSENNENANFYYCSSW